MHAYDKDGIEVFAMTINTICPVEFSVRAKQLAFGHMKNLEKCDGDKPEQMLNVNLGPVGSTKMTHIFCSRFGYTHQVEMVVKHFLEEDLSWGSTRAYSLDDSPDEIKSRFCIVVGDTQDLLTSLGLEVKT